MNLPTISVVIPVFNGEKYMEEALDSVMAQTQQPGEVLVFDNASTDRTREIALARLSPDAVIASATNGGAAYNINRAAAGATGDFVLWLAADDVLEPDHLRRCTAALLRLPDAPACLPGVAFIDESGAVQRTQSDSALASATLKVRLRSFLRRKRWTEFYCLYRRSTISSMPPVNTAYGADVSFTWWLLLRHSLAVVEEPLLKYREYPKTVEEVARSLDPTATPPQWLMLGLWKRLWIAAKADDLPARTTRRARRELVLCLLSEAWFDHIVGDVTRRWPRSTRPLDLLRALLVFVVRCARRLDLRSGVGTWRRRTPRAQ